MAAGTQPDRKNEKRKDNVMNERALNAFALTMFGMSYASLDEENASAVVSAYRFWNIIDAEYTQHEMLSAAHRQRLAFLDEDAGEVMARYAIAEFLRSTPSC